MYFKLSKFINDQSVICKLYKGWFKHRKLLHTENQLFYNRIILFIKACILTVGSIKWVEYKDDKKLKFYNFKKLHNHEILQLCSVQKTIDFPATDKIICFLT